MSALNTAGLQPATKGRKKILKLQKVNSDETKRDGTRLRYRIGEGKKKKSLGAKMKDSEHFGGGKSRKERVRRIEVLKPDNTADA